MILLSKGYQDEVEAEFMLGFWLGCGNLYRPSLALENRDYQQMTDKLNMNRCMNMFSLKHLKSFG